MSQRITIQIEKQIATCLTELPVVCGNSKYEAEFLFDEEWGTHNTKTAVFIVNGKSTKTVFEGNVCRIPPIQDALIFRVGVFAGTVDDGTLSTTTSALVRCKPCVTDGGNVPAPPADDVYNQIVALCENAVETAESVERRADEGEFDGEDYALTPEDMAEIAEQAADLISYVQDEEPVDAPENSFWIDTSEDCEIVSQDVVCNIANGIRVIDNGLEYSRGIVEIRKVGSILWIIDSGVYNFTGSFTAKNNRTVLEFELPKKISNKIYNVNGIYGSTGTVGYFPALAYENVTYTTFNCQSYLKRTVIGVDNDTYQLVYTGVNSINGGGLCGFHLKMPLIMVDEG